MKLYAHPFSNNSMRAQLGLDEKGLDYDTGSSDAPA
jgi:glutathione S-transferase